MAKKIRTQKVGLFAVLWVLEHLFVNLRDIV